MNEQQNVTTPSTDEPTTRQEARDVEVQSGYALVPDVDIYEDADGIHLRADMPGVSRDRLDIQVNHDTLAIRGEARIDMPPDMEATHADVRATRFERSFVLSRELDTDAIDAGLKDGVLSVHIPRRAETRPRRVEVQIG